MGEMADLSLENADWPDYDGFSDLTVCVICEYQDCFVDNKFVATCPICGLIEKY